MKKAKFEHFYNQNINKIYRFVIFRVGNKETAEDLVSEIFFKALEHFDDFDPKISKSAWLFTIAKNHLANHWRDKKATIPLPDNESEDGLSNDNFWLTSAKVDFYKNATKIEVQEFLSSLDEKNRKIVTLHYLFGYSYAEISEILNMTETAVKVACHRAIKKLSFIL